MTRKISSDIHNAPASDEQKTRMIRPAAPNTPDMPQPTPIMPSPGALAGDGKTKIIRPGGSQEAGVPGQQNLVAEATDPVVGWLVVVQGPGRGEACPIYYGMNQIGRDPGQRIQVNFGDEAISRDSHAFVIYDDEQRKFFAQHGGKTNLVRVNNTPVMAPTELSHGDKVRLGNTTLLFVPLCGPKFDWQDDLDDNSVPAEG